MSTASTFTKSITILDIKQPAQSVGAHLGAKLDLFSTDERTLTDELCDMLCIWLGVASKAAHPLLSPMPQFSIRLSKTTSAEEVKNGADLDLKITSPLGSKRCLIQAKVLDPTTLKLRCNSTAGWNKLRKQLVASRKEVGDLAFLLVYVPGRLLNAKHYGFGTYEQAHFKGAGGSAEAAHGATLIAVDDLIGPKGRWRSKFKVPSSAPGEFKKGIPLWRFLMELMLCRRGKWGSPNIAYQEGSQRRPPFRELGITISGIEPGAWAWLQASADRWINADDVPPFEQS